MCFDDYAVHVVCEHFKDMPRGHNLSPKKSNMKHVFGGSSLNLLFVIYYIYIIIYRYIMIVLIYSENNYGVHLVCKARDHNPPPLPKKFRLFGYA